MGPTRVEDIRTKHVRIKRNVCVKEIRTGIGEASMTIQERLRVLRELNSLQTTLQTTLMQPIAEDRGLVVICCSHKSGIRVVC